MKIVRATEVYKYEAPGHFDVRTLRIHNPADVKDGQVTMGISHFLPEGGADFAVAKFEMVYYIVSGEMTVTTDDGEYVLGAGDSIHIAAGEGRGSKNNTKSPATMLVVMIKK